MIRVKLTLEDLGDPLLVSPEHVSFIREVHHRYTEIGVGNNKIFVVKEDMDTVRKLITHQQSVKHFR